jgi:hypothetical protein
MQPLTKKFLLCCATLICQSLVGQTQLAPVQAQSFASIFTKSKGRHLVDTIYVAPGHMLKIENCASALLRNGVLEPISNYGIEINDILIYQNRESLPFWLGPGTHFVYYNNLETQIFTYKLSIHGIMFLHQ